MDYPLILPEESWPLRALLDRELAKLVQPPRVMTTSNSVEFLRRMIDEQLGVGFQTVVGIERSLRRGDLVHVPITDPRPLRQSIGLCVAKQSPNSEALSAFMDLFREHLEQYCQDWR